MQNHDFRGDAVKTKENGMCYEIMQHDVKGQLFLCKQYGPTLIGNGTLPGNPPFPDV